MFYIPHDLCFFPMHLLLLQPLRHIMELIVTPPVKQFVHSWSMLLLYALTLALLLGFTLTQVTGMCNNELECIM